MRDVRSHSNSIEMKDNVCLEWGVRHAGSCKDNPVSRRTREAAVCEAYGDELNERGKIRNWSFHVNLEVPTTSWE